MNLYHNNIAQFAGTKQGFVAVRFEGANQTNEAGDGACRDGYGAFVSAHVGSKIIKREHRCGDGFAVQNSNTMIVGIGDRDYVESVEVVWPSGRTQTTGVLCSSK